MPEWLVQLAMEGWLVAAVLLFVIIIVLTYRPGARREMKEHAQIPFKVEDENDGRS